MKNNFNEILIRSHPFSLLFISSVFRKSIVKGINQSLKQFSVLFCALIFLSTSAYAVDFSFTDTQGESHSLAEYKGKWVLVNFWATWCPPCRKEIPDLSDFHLQSDDAVVIGVNYEPGLKDERLKKFIELYLVTYPVTRVNDEIIEAIGEPRGLPTSVLIDPQGNIAKKITGMLTHVRLKKIIAEYNIKTD